MTTYPMPPRLVLTSQRSPPAKWHDHGLEGSRGRGGGVHGLAEQGIP